ncbi:uncharacterized protein LOC113861052 [Abrus precatorius]|uniref:Uncharacterized protein LOC113861052 n=1 Tax=Abrus precatorius TaxID=3816 RepID=A0A8B8L459_ABRPR|nr:uncharacterized protein LOC113861052 [Abrus precatorius]
MVQNSRNESGVYAAAKISVWWDIEKCPVPKGHDANSIANNIAAALVNINYNGPLSISAYGDTNRIPSPVQRALSSTGIALNHVPSGSNSYSSFSGCKDMKILVDMLFWAVDNPAPANYLMISGDRDFSMALHQLSLRRYNILLAQPFQASASLVAAAKVVWLWTTLSAGGAPLYIADSDSSSGKINPTPIFEPVQLKSKPKYVRKITNVPESPTKCVADDDDNAKPLTKLIFKAPHEFFSCNDVIVPNTVVQSLAPPSEYVRGLVDVVMRALNTLKVEMVLSTEGNITDCIRYGDYRYQRIDVRKALDFAIEQHGVVKRTFGALHLYVGKDGGLWKFVNHVGGQPSDFPEATWDRIKQFIASSSGRSSILASRCRYEASLIIRRLCLGEFLLGDVLRILEMVITVKKWIIHRHSGWQPITITLMETKGDTL